MCLQVHSTVVPCPLQDSSSVGKAICDYAASNKPAALVMMKENKGAIARLVLLLPFQAVSIWLGYCTPSKHSIVAG